MRKRLLHLVLIISILFIGNSDYLFCNSNDDDSKITSTPKLIFGIDRDIGTIPTISKRSEYHYEIWNYFSADSGTGNTHSGILNVSLDSESSIIENLYISSDQPYFVFKSRPGEGKQDPFPDYRQDGYVYNLKYGNYLDLDLIFKPSIYLQPGDYVCNLKFEAESINDSGYVRIEVPVRVYYNPYEWSDYRKEPGIELILHSNRGETSNLIFGSGYEARDIVDTTYGEDYYQYPMGGIFEGRFFYDEHPYHYPYGLKDIAPNDEAPYSHSRDIRKFEHESKPLIYHVKIYSEAEDYPIILEYDEFNFPDDALFILTESLDDNPKFKIDMRKTTVLAEKRHQYVISDTSVKDFYIIYYKSKDSLLFTENPHPWKNLYCPLDTINIPFSTYGTFNEGNRFIAELSDTNGSWLTNVREIGSVSGQSSSEINALLPEDVIEGFNYKVRIRSTDPEYIGSENELRIGIFPGEPLVKYYSKADGYPQHIIELLSPVNSRIYLFNTPEGGMPVKTGMYYIEFLSLPVDTIFVEAKSVISDCITLKRAKVVIKYKHTSVTELNYQGSDFQIVPNPSNGNFQLIMDSKKVTDAIITIYDQLGRKIVGKSIDLTDGTNSVPLSIPNDNNNGLYIVNVIIGDKRFVEKVLIVR